MQQVPPFLGHDDNPRRRVDYPIHDTTLHRRWPGKNRMKRRDDRHGQPRQQGHDVTTCGAAEDAELVLKRDGLEPARIQEHGRTGVIFDLVVFDLKTDSRRVIVGSALIGHRHDAGIDIRTRCGDRLLKMRRECRDPASARQGIPNERETVDPSHDSASTE